MVGFDLEAVHNVDGMIPVALDLWRDGLHPVPLADGRKEPPRGFPLSRWLESEPTEGDVVEAFRGRRNIAVALGEPSGGLVCRDFDRLDEYDAWRQRVPHLARTCPTVRTHRGAHCYFHATAHEVASYCSPGSTGTIAVFPGGQGELRGGGYVAYPPSRHPDGPIYRFEIPPTDYPFIDNILDAGLIPRFWSMREIAPQAPGISCVTSPLTVDQIVVATLPKCAGERHECLFQLIRLLRGHPETGTADPRDLKSVVQQWFRRAYRVIGTKDFGVTWREFLDGWARARVPAGATIASISREAQGERIEWLADLCRLLQCRAGDEPFFLDCRTAAQIMAVSAMSISRWLRQLRAERRIELVRAGSHVQHRASAYRYLRPMDAAKLQNADMSAF